MHEASSISPLTPAALPPRSADPPLHMPVSARLAREGTNSPHPHRSGRAEGDRSSRKRRNSEPSGRDAATPPSVKVPVQMPQTEQKGLGKDAAALLRKGVAAAAASLTQQGASKVCHLPCAGGADRLM